MTEENCRFVIISAFDSAHVKYSLRASSLGGGSGKGKEERACNDVSGIFISASKKSMQNADWWILNLVLTSLLFACVLLTIQKWWKAEFLFVKVARISRNNLGFLWN